MDKRTYIQTDDNSINLLELLLLKIDGLEQKVCTLSNPAHAAQLYTESDVAGILKVTKRTVFNLRKNGKIHFRDLEIGIRYSMEDILEFEDKCRKRET